MNKSNFLLLFVFVANMLFAQNQQLKTYHSYCPGGAEFNGLSYTGYEDELGGVTKHGLFTVKLNKGTLSLNFKNGILDGEGSITSPNITCKLMYSNNKLVSVDYVEKGTGDEILVYKYSINEENRLVGDFELKQISHSLNDNAFMKGQFDNSGRATGWWSIKKEKNSDVIQYFYENGFCLGSDEKTIEISRKYLIDSLLSDKDIHNLGLYLSNKPMISDLSSGLKLFQNYFCNHFNIDGKETCVDTKMRNRFNLSFNERCLEGSPISYMSEDLYKKIVSAIHGGNSTYNIGYDVFLKKYYVLKADNESRLYIPLDSESEFESMEDSKWQCPEAHTITDIDGNVYKTVKIGQQCWMKENLRTTKYADGTSIPMITRKRPDGTSISIPKIKYPNGTSSYKDVFGLLYDWTTIMHNESSSKDNPNHIQGICPNGWHIPSVYEWEQLLNYVGSQTQYRCNPSFKEDIAKSLASTTSWKKALSNCTVGFEQGRNNATGFSALPAGGFFDEIEGFGKESYFWSYIHIQQGYYTSTDAWACCNLSYNSFTVDKRRYDPSVFLSVRCVKD